MNVLFLIFVFVSLCISPWLCLCMLCLGGVTSRFEGARMEACDLQVQIWELPPCRMVPPATFSFGVRVCIVWRSRCVRLEAEG